jgi:hypothetical protein
MPKRKPPEEPTPAGWVAWLRKPPGPWHAIAEYYTAHGAWKDLQRALKRCELRGQLASGCVKPVGRRPDQLDPDGSVEPEQNSEPEEPTDGD